MKIALLALLFFAAAVVNGLAHRHSELDAWMPFSAVYLLIGSAILARRRWAPAAIFGSAVCFATIWVTTVALLLVQGAWPSDSLAESAVSLVPGLVHLAFWFGMWRLVASHFGTVTPETEKTAPPH